MWSDLEPGQSTMPCEQEKGMGGPTRWDNTVIPTQRAAKLHLSFRQRWREDSAQHRAHCAYNNNRATIKGTNIKYFLSDFTVAITLQECSATLDAQVKRGQIYFLWPEVCFRDLLLLSSARAPSQPTPSYLPISGSTKQQTAPGSQTPISYFVPGTELFIAVSLAPAPASREMDRLLNMDLYHLQQLCWPICEIALRLLEACARDALFPPPSSSTDGLGLSACQLSLGTVWHQSTSGQWKSVCSQFFQ